MTWRTRIHLLLALLALAFCTNLAGAFALYRVHYYAYARGGMRPQVNVIGPDAANHGWPLRPPMPWPPPTQWSMERRFGFAHVGAWHSSDRQTQFQMTAARYGWPGPVFEQAQFWWPWDDPAWQTTEPTETGLRIYWPGLLITPLLIATPLWLILITPGMVRAAVRRRRARCEACGYPIGSSPVCTECGRPLRGSGALPS